MTTYNSPFLASSAGVPSQESDTFNPVLQGLIAGETPGVVVVDKQMAANQTIGTEDAPFVPVGYDGSGDLIPAVSGTTQAIGLALKPTTTAVGVKAGMPTMIQGCVNMDMIAWPASYDTDAKKLAAFEGADTPTAIVVRKRIKGATVSAP